MTDEQSSLDHAFNEFLRIRKSSVDEECTMRQHLRLTFKAGADWATRVERASDETSELHPMDPREWVKRD